MRRSERFRREACFWGSMAISAAMLGVAAGCGLWAILAPHPGAWLAPAIISVVTLFVVAVFTGQALRNFAACERERHWEAENYLRTIR
jgi:uncharacterized membrane protein